MKEMKTIKFPHDSEPYEIVDDYARKKLTNISWNDIVDKPFKESDQLIYDTTENILNRNITTTINDIVFIHCSDETPAKEALVNGKIIIYFEDNSSMNIDILEEYIIVFNDNFCILNLDGAFFGIFYNTGTFDLLGDGTFIANITKIGSYVPYDFLMEINPTSIELVSHTKKLSTDVLPMDEIKTYIDDYINEALGGDY